MLGFLEGFGIIGIILLVTLILLIPFVLTVILGIAFANMLGFTGITWWAFIVIFYLIVSGILSIVAK